MKKQVLKQINSLQFGDLVEVAWLDASEDTDQLEHEHYDTPVQSVGYFLGVKGRKTRHVVIAKEIINNKHYHYNVIPIGMIENIRILKKNALAPKVKRVFKKFAVKTMPRLRKKDGWCYGNRKKVVKDHVEKLD